MRSSAATVGHRHAGDERYERDFRERPAWYEVAPLSDPVRRTALRQTTLPDNSGAVRNRGIDHSEAHKGGVYDTGVPQLM